jgi:hypothetical protein
LPVSPADPRHPVSDPALVAAIASATARRADGSTEPRVSVEVLTAHDAQVAATVQALGGTVTGSVPGAVVQASIPISSADDVALSPGVEFVQAPRLVNQRPRRAESVGFGATVNEGVAAMNAAAWQNAGIRGGGVRVGIIDFFTTANWNASEQGTKPSITNGHMFCRDSAQVQLCNADGSINSAQGDVHGLAVAEIVKDTAPDADLFIASTSTLSDLRSAIDWFSANGVSIITRSLGSAYDGPGDGTGPLDSVVDYAASKGIVWFNSAGNDAGDGYMKVQVAATNANNAVEFAPGDDLLRLNGDGNGCFQIDGIRWANDWYLPPKQRTDYRVEVFQPASPGDIGSEHTNPANLIPVDLYPATPGVQSVVDADQRGGAEPLEMADQFWCTTTGVSYLRIVRNAATPVGAVPDTLEIASTFRDLEYTSDPGGSAAKPAVDSSNPSLVAVGALDSATANAVAFYSSQGPTSDGRIKPDVVAPSCITSTVYSPGCFAGTSAASPAAAGFAALVLSSGLATGGDPLAAMVRHLTVDIGAPGPDNASGAGKIELPAPPTPLPAAAPSAYIPVGPVRIMDTRTGSPVGIQPVRGIIDLRVTGGNGVPSSGATAVAVNITSVDSLVDYYVQALPTLHGTVGATSTLNVSVVGKPRPNFAIVPVGEGGSITLYMPTGGNVVVDLLGYFSPAPSGVSAAGRFVAVQPERWMDTRSASLLPAGFSGVRHVGAGETVAVQPLAGSAVPTSGVSALVVNLTSDDASAPGFLRLIPTGTGGLDNSTVNYLPGTPSANTSIVQLGAGGTVSVFSYASTHVIVDVVGYITDGSASPGPTGLFVALTPGRSYDSRSGAPFATNSTRTVQLAQLGAPAPSVPANAMAVSTNLTADQGEAVGFVEAWPAGAPIPATSNLNFAANAPVANASLMKLGVDGAVSVFVNHQTHVIIDVNGYFTGT